jgi:hypothetical protein
VTCLRASYKELSNPRRDTPAAERSGALRPKLRGAASEAAAVRGARSCNACKAC